MEKTLRKRDFKLGQIHGRLQADKEKSEAQIQRTLFLSQKINLHLCRKKTVTIRLFGYEVPLEENTSRGRCLDLMGYDENHNLYLIELKDENSQERIAKVKQQIMDYERKVHNMLLDLQHEFKREFYLSIDFSKGEVYKIVLAPRSFYSNRQRLKEINDLYNDNIIYADFGGRNIYDCKPGKPINVHLNKICSLSSTAARMRLAARV